MNKIIKRVLSVFLCAILIANIFPVNVTATEAREVYATTYCVGEYNFHTDTDGGFFAMIDDKMYSFSDDFELNEISKKLQKMENQNVVYEIHHTEIAAVYTMDEVLTQDVTVEPDIKDGLIYRNGKFSQKSFGLVVKVTNKLNGLFRDKDLLWYISESEKGRLYTKLKNLAITPSDKVDFGSSGWWMWKNYENEISENKNDVIKLEETKEYKYTVNLHNDGVVNQREYNLNLYVTPTFDTGEGRREKGTIPVGNLDYQEEKIEQKKKTSNSGQCVTQASTQLDGIKNAIQFNKDYFSSAQTDQINEFVNIWISDLILAKYAEKSELEEYISGKMEDIVNKWLNKLGVDTNVLTIPGKIQATSYMKTQTKDGTKLIIQFNINLSSFDFGNTGMPTMATGSGTATIYNMDGEKLDSSVILPAYANVSAFCEQLQNVAKSTIFSAAKQYCGIFGSAGSTAEALSSKMMEKILNNKYAKKYFKLIDAKDVKTVLKKIVEKGENILNNKIFELVTTPSKGGTEVSVKCPVDVKIYDNDGNLCGVVKDNVVDSTYDDIFVTVVGDQKNIYMVGDDYSFELTGTDEGSMDYVVREFDESGKTTRQILYRDVKLTDGCKYYAYVPEAVNLSNTLFDLTDGEGNIISPTTGADTDITVVRSGTCGDGVEFRVTDEGILRIYGNGKMDDFSYGRTPWSIDGDPISDTIETVIIEGGVKKIGSNAFLRLKNLSKIMIPDSVSEFGNEGCGMRGKLKTAGLIGSDCDIQFNWTKQIPANAFSGCTGLVSIELPETITHIGKRAFCNNKNLNKLVIPGNVSEMGEYAMEGCENLKTAGPTGGEYDIQFGWKKEIPDHSFHGCMSLEQIEIPKSISKIGEQAFSVSGIKRIELSENITELGKYAFWNCERLENILYDIICLEADRKLVYTYTDGMFGGAGKESQNITLTIGDNVTDIPDYIFKKANIKELVIGEKVEYMGVRAFELCESIEKIYYNAKNLSVIEAGPFISGLSQNGLELIIGDNVESIQDSFFFNGYEHNHKYPLLCRKIVMGKNFKKFNDDLYELNTIEEIEVSLENQYFSSMDGVLYDKEKTKVIRYPAAKQGTDYRTPDSVIQVGRKAFQDCTNIAQIELGEDIKTIEEEAFYKCANLKRINVPDNVEAVGKKAFYNCNSLEEINIPKKLVKIEADTFNGCNNLNNVVLPEGLIAIEDGAFLGCSKLTDVVIPESVWKVRGFDSALNSVTVYNRGCDIKGAFGEVGIVYGYKVSSAKSYAEARKIKFVALDEKDEESGNPSDDEDSSGDLGNNNVRNPRISDNGVTTWDCIYFGNYWTDGEFVSNQLSSTDMKPIKWRVLSVDGNDAFLIADTNLTKGRMLDYQNESSTWETCETRKWLNGTVLNQAFSLFEKMAIKDTIVVNKDNPVFKTKGGETTTDKLYLPSIDEMLNPEYGFTSKTSSSKSRQALNTDFISDHLGGNCDFWWLRSPGDTNQSSSCVDKYGGINQYGISESAGVRPVMHIDLSSTYVWAYAGTVSSDGTVRKLDSDSVVLPTMKSSDRPLVHDENVTWDAVFFGHYWQNDTNGDGVADQKDQKEPIKWRVLEIKDGYATLFADRILDVQSYTNRGAWSASTVRKWLNETFMSNAFSYAEQQIIAGTESETPVAGNGQEKIEDKVYLLASKDATTYGWFGQGSPYSDAVSRRGLSTEYAKQRGACIWENSYSWWWLKDTVVWPEGCLSIYAMPAGGNVTGGIRPALRIKISKSDLWSYAGTVSTDEMKDIPTSILFPMPSGAPSQNVKSPSKTEEGATQWDCVYFGNYWQNDTNGDGKADSDDEKTPIKWRVLSTDGEDVFLMADKCLDFQSGTGGDWERSELRKWLNESFYNNAFTTSEKSAIRDTEIVNARNPKWGTSSGNDTVDRVYLLSVYEAMNPEYGFSADSKNSNTRTAAKTDFAKNGVSYGGYYWLRTMGIATYGATYVDMERGYVSCEGDNGEESIAGDGFVRPVLRMNLSDHTLWSYAGTVSSDGTENEVTAPSPSPTVSPTKVPTSTPAATAKPTQTPIPTVKPTLKPTDKPGMFPTLEPLPTAKPTAEPIFTPSDSPKPSATVTPDLEPTTEPADQPTEQPQVPFDPTPIQPPSQVTSDPVPAVSATVTKPEEEEDDDDDEEDDFGDEIEKLKKGSYFMSGNFGYKITKLKKKKGEITVVCVKSKNSKEYVIPNKVKKQGITFTVTSVQANTFQGCKKAKTLTIKATGIKTIAKKGLNGLNKRIPIKVPKKKLWVYRKMLQKCGYRVIKS